MATEDETPPYEPSQEAKDLYAKHIAQAWTDQQASSDAFDNNLLSFSSAALGLSVAFVKDVVPLDSAEWLRILYSSWIAFASCILVTIASFQIAVRAQFAHQKTLADYYLKGDAKAIERTNPWTNALPFCAGIGSVCLLVGIVCTIIFASHNVSHYKESKAWQMTTRQRK